MRQPHTSSSSKSPKTITSSPHAASWRLTCNKTICQVHAIHRRNGKFGSTHRPGCILGSYIVSCIGVNRQEPRVTSAPRSGCHHFPQGVATCPLKGPLIPLKLGPMRPLGSLESLRIHLCGRHEEPSYLHGAAGASFVRAAEGDIDRSFLTIARCGVVNLVQSAIPGQNQSRQSWSKSVPSVSADTVSAM